MIRGEKGASDLTSITDGRKIVLIIVIVVDVCIFHFFYLQFWFSHIDSEGYRVFQVETS